MRVLVTTPAGLGHIHPMVPLARVLAHRGHEVRWALPEQVAGPVAERAIEVIPIAAREPITPQEAIRRFPDLGNLPLRERPDAMFGKLFGAMATPPMLEGLEPIALDWRPHLVIADAAEFAGHIVAARLGIPSVTKGFGALLPEVRVARAAEEVAALWNSRGLEPRPYGGAYDHLYIDIYPPEMQVEAGEHVRHRQLMRPVTDDGAADRSTLSLPRARRDRPLVYVTMGTVFNDPEPLRRAVEGVRALDVRVLATVGPAAVPAVLGGQPSHVVVESYVPQTAVLPHCDVVVSHGGSGTVLGALMLGLPQVCLPQGADQFLNAKAVAASGAGLAITPDAASRDSIGEAVAAVLGNEFYRKAAHRVALSIESMPSVEDVAAVLEELA
ncbi:MAG: glycosyltransferase [Chloroflexota bacterium]|nr:glycosyltransferase [Chloroflexota bacterium]